MNLTMIPPVASEVEIEREAYHLPIDGIASKLVELAGVFVAGTVGGVKSERTVRGWVAGEHPPEREPQLRFAYRIARMIATTCGPSVVQSWFKGANSSLDDRAPSLLLRDDFSETTQRAILNAARRLAQ
jgi:hypothetical protein